MELMQNDLNSLPISTDKELIRQCIPISTRNPEWIELGCGDASTIKQLAVELPSLQIQAFEVDEVQHAKNLSCSSKPDNISFGLAGMEQIPANDESVDAVLMLKSLHHVPAENHEKGFQEVHRVLKEGGVLYVSEPVSAGDLHEIMRLHEEHVRGEAFESIQAQLKSGNFVLETEIHFRSPFDCPRGFADFEERVMGATHTRRKISEQTLKTVKERFSKYVQADGSAKFFVPGRVDVLVKPCQGDFESK